MTEQAPTQTTSPALRRRVLQTTPIFPPITEPKLLHSVVENDIYLLGGQVAILCQFAHPSLAKGSYKHSDFAARIHIRLRNTARFLNAAVCGTPQEKNAIFGVIHRYHSRVKGDGYDADDPELHKWTAATLFVGVVLVHETFFGKLSTEKMDGLLKEAAVFGTSLRMPPEMWPATLDEFWQYWDYNIATLEVTDMARKMSRDLLYPRNLPFSMAMAIPFARLLTLNWLPERLAREYDLRASVVEQFACQGLVLWMRVVYPFVPNYVKQYQHRAYMEDLRKAVEKIEVTGHWGGI